MYSSSFDARPPGLMKKRQPWQQLLQEYGGIAAGVLLFVAVCAIVALMGQSSYWKQQAADHSMHREKITRAHSSLEQALQSQNNNLRELHGHKSEAQERVLTLEQELEENHRALATSQSEMHRVQTEHREAQHEFNMAKHDLNTCLDRVREFEAKHVEHHQTHTGTRQELADLKQRLEAHQTRELQLLEHKQDLEHAVAVLKAEAEAKGIKLEDPPGLTTSGLLSGDGAIPVTTLPQQPVPSAPDLKPTLANGSAGGNPRALLANATSGPAAAGAVPSAPGGANATADPVIIPGAVVIPSAPGTDTQPVVTKPFEGNGSEPGAPVKAAAPVI